MVCTQCVGVEMKVQFLSKKTIKEFVKGLESRRDIDQRLVDSVKKCSEAKIVEFEKFRLYVFDGVPMFFEREGLERPMPTLYIINVMLNREGVLVTPAVVVDEGAVNPILRGAHVMAPGIRRVLKDFSKDDVVAVLEPGQKYAIAVGLAIMDSKDIVPGTKGRAILNVSRLNDEIWNRCLEIARKSGS